MKLKNLFPDSQQIARIIILVSIVLGLLIVGFGSYYYYDRYVDTSNSVSPLQQSVSELEQSIRDDPADIESRLALAETYLFSGRYDDAIELTQEIYDLDPTNERAMLILGISLASTNHYEQAIEPLKKFVDIRNQHDMANFDTGLETALYFLGDCYIQTEQIDEAIKALERALEINRTDADAMYKLGLAYAAANQHEKAIASYENAIRFVPDFAEVYQGMVNSYEALGMPAKATYAQGMLAYSVKDYKSAQANLESVIAAEADFVPAYFGLGLVYEQLGDLENAKLYAELTLQLDPENMAAIQLNGRVDAASQK